MTIERHGSGGEWEDRVGYSRVVRSGPHVWVSGCTASGPGGSVIGDTPGAQAEQALRVVAEALQTAGARLEDVVRTRIFVTDISRWEEVGLAHGAVFADIKPVNTMVEVSGLIDPRLLVEIEAEAFVADATTA